MASRLLACRSISAALSVCSRPKRVAASMARTNFTVASGCCCAKFLWTMVTARIGGRVGLCHLLPFVDHAAEDLQLEVGHRGDGHCAQRSGVDVAALQERHELRLVAADRRIVRGLEPEIPFQHRGGDRVGGAADRRHADLLALEIGDRFDRRAFLGDEGRFRDLGREHDLDRRALDAERKGAGGRRREGHVDRLGEDRLGRGVDLGETDIFRHQPLLLHELAGLQHRAEPDAEAARPISDLDLLLRVSARRGAADRGGEGKEQRASDPACDHVCVSCVGSASSEARNSLASAMAFSRSDPRLRQRNVDGAADAAGPRRHHHDVIGENHRLLHVVGDEQDRHRAHGVDAQRARGACCRGSARRAARTARPSAEFAARRRGCARAPRGCACRRRAGADRPWSNPPSPTRSSTARARRARSAAGMRPPRARARRCRSPPATAAGGRPGTCSRHGSNPPRRWSPAPSRRSARRSGTEGPLPY